MDQPVYLQDQVAKIIADDRVQGAALTGSEKAGSVVAAQAAKHIKKSTLELGGNDVFVVLDDADLERAVKIGVQARLNNAGRCVYRCQALYPARKYRGCVPDKI